MAGLEAALTDRLNRVEEADRFPIRVVGFYRDSVPSTALYLEIVLESERVVPVIVHNLRYYERGMQRWRTGVIETIVLNELHELTHWALTDRELAELRDRSAAAGVPDGHIINPRLLTEIDWVHAGFPAVYEPDPPTWKVLTNSILEWVRTRLGWDARVESAADANGRAESAVDADDRNGDADADEDTF